MNSAHKHAERKIRISYEWSRVRRAALILPIPLALILISLWLGQQNSVWFFGIPLCIGMVGFGWYGRELTAAIWPGIGAGLIPFLFAHTAKLSQHDCGMSRCTSWCVPACIAGGVLAAVFISRLAHKFQTTLPTTTGAASVTLLTGALACTCAGFSGVIGLVVGFSTSYALNLGLRAAISRN